MKIRLFIKEFGFTKAVSIFAIFFLAVFTIFLPVEGRSEHQAEVLEERYMPSFSKVFNYRNYKGAFIRFKKIEKLHADLPDFFEFYVGVAYYSLGKYWEATYALNAYLKKAGKKGRHYNEALGIMAMMTEVKKVEAAKNNMVFIKGGCFQMGDTFGDGWRIEKPAHYVCLDDFYIGKYEVTQREWQELMGYNPSGFKGCDDCPVETVSWSAVQKYIKKLSRKTGVNYRLPTEAEWEYAARNRGKKLKYSWGSGSPSGNIAYPMSHVRRGYDYDDGYAYTAPVGTFVTNKLGLYDMSGNVWEWVNDWYGKDYYMKSPRNNPTGPSNGEFRLIRGGSWFSVPKNNRTSVRARFAPETGGFLIGFRLAVSNSDLPTIIIVPQLKLGLEVEESTK